ncbi:Pex15p TDEL_0H03630 [Torulaspora delbrueckii]|uniref:Uncharacterized protein n=1 Tax=Torulaspora delbrueckii TaxID=4950 RepID=G9A028_TORDE|nr:hypothetical protein TDEL_0H03630 [Torulaspora delbrueckii]CCE94222.1 hypothetical protein TDEL_0H03630 [Torulaspora delbrueckii]
MSETKLDGGNGLPDGGASTVTTLEELLNDESFNYSASSIAFDEDTKYHECLTMFIAGDPERCLQKMYEYGLLSKESIQNNDKVFNLFQEACYAIGNFNRFGFRLQDVILENFTGDPQVLQCHLMNCTLASEISILNRYYRCSAKALLMEKPINEEKATGLEIQTRRTIARIGSRVRVPDEALEFQQLIGTYIFTIQIKLLQKTPSFSLYKKLCDRIPNLSDQLKKWPSTYKEKTIEGQILSQLEHMYSKAKKQHQRRRTNSAAISESVKPSTQVTAKKDKLQRPVNWLSLWHKYFSRMNLSRQNLLFLLIFLLISLQITKKLVKFPIFFTQFSRKILIQLKSILSLLSSV